MTDFLSAEQVAQLIYRRSTPVTVYLVGAGGAGMSALGHLLLDLGHVVCGSDLTLSDELLHLRARGARIHIGHLAEQIAAARPALVVYSSAIRLNNPELEMAQQRQIPVVRRAALLSALVNRSRGICVAGMHGKTTTSALLAFALEQLGANPSYAVGAAVPQLPRPARIAGSATEGGAPNPNGSSPPDDSWFVVEADESDGTLRGFRPEHVLLLNIDEEHLDYFASLEAICREFQEFGEQARGRVVFCADDPWLARLFTQKRQAISYGFHPLATYRIGSAQSISGRGLAHDGLKWGSVFDLWTRGEVIGSFTTQLMGEKNVLNAAAVIALLHQMGYAAADIARAILPFRGAKRRLEEIFSDERFVLFDDYGHHPSEIAATIRALKTLQPRRLLLAFQPHRYTRTHLLLKQFSHCFAGADLLWLTHIYAANEAEIPGVNGKLLADAVRATGQDAQFVGVLADLPAVMRQSMRAGDIVLFVGAGDITRTAHKLAMELHNEPSTETERWCTDLTRTLSAETLVRRNEPMAKRTTLRVGGKTDLYVEPASETDLGNVLRFCGERSIPFVVLGRGSNLLIRDGGVRGVVLCLAHPNFSHIEALGDRLHCGAGVRLKQVAYEARKQGLAGLEFLEGIPGTIGGALRMNAGAMGNWMFEIVENIRLMDYAGQVHERRASEINVEYRGCPLLKTHIALGAVLKGQQAAPEIIEQKMHVYSEKRWDSQPAAASAGCIFKNPASIPAGKLIDELGLKGMRIGGAIVSDVHGNFIINDGNATAEDVLQLIALIRSRAKASRGIDLEMEVEVIGE